MRWQPVLNKNLNIVHSGDTFRHKFKIDESLYNGFQSLFKDRNPLHTDKQFASSYGFRDVVMYGNLLGGFISYFIGECLPQKNVIIHSQTIHYYKPVYLGDQLMFEAQVRDIHESVNAIDFDFIFRNSDEQRIAKGKIQIGILK